MRHTLSVNCRNKLLRLSDSSRCLTHTHTVRYTAVQYQSFHRSAKWNEVLIIYNRLHHDRNKQLCITNVCSATARHNRQRQRYTTSLSSHRWLTTSTQCCSRCVSSYSTGTSTINTITGTNNRHFSTSSITYQQSSSSANSTDPRDNEIIK